MNDYSDVVGIVESTSFESMCLWEKWHQQRGHTWVASTSGPLITVGYLDGKPVGIAPLVHEVNGKKIMFVEPTSLVVDWGMIDDWLRENVPNARKGDFLNKQRAMNFHCLIHGA